MAVAGAEGAEHQAEGGGIQRALALEAQGSATAGRPGEVALAAAATSRQGKTILELRGVAVAHAADPENPDKPDKPDKPDNGSAAGAPLNAPFDLILTAEDRIGIVGANGVGKTTLLRAVLAAVEERRGPARRRALSPKVVSGEIVVGKNTRVAYLDQARARLDDTKSIFDDVRGESGATVVNLGVPGIDALDLRSYLEMFLFDPQKQRQKVGALSGGERARVALAKVLREGANLLVFDEPTNDLDLPTLAALEEMLDGYPGSVIVVTHDRAFLDRVATAILSFEIDPAGGLATVERHAGGYEDYVSHKKEERARQAESAGGGRGEAKPAANSRRGQARRQSRGRAGSPTPSGSSSRGSWGRSTPPKGPSRRSKRGSPTLPSTRPAAAKSPASKPSSPPRKGPPPPSSPAGSSWRRRRPGPPDAYGVFAPRPARPAKYFATAAAPRSWSALHDVAASMLSASGTEAPSTSFMRGVTNPTSLSRSASRHVALTSVTR